MAEVVVVFLVCVVPAVAEGGACIWVKKRKRAINFCSLNTQARRLREPAKSLGAKERGLIGGL